MSSLPTCDHNPQFQNLSREELLGNLEAGDIIHGIGPDGAVLLCLVLAVHGATIRARRIPTQQPYTFDRRTGAAISGDGWSKSSITSVEPLPPHIYDVFLDMDRQYRLGHRKERDFKLSALQKEALLFTHAHYARYPLGE